MYDTSRTYKTNDSKRKKVELPWLLSFTNTDNGTYYLKVENLSFESPNSLLKPTCGGFLTYFSLIPLIEWLIYVCISKSKSLLPTFNIYIKRQLILFRVGTNTYQRVYTCISRWITIFHNSFTIIVCKNLTPSESIVDFHWDSSCHLKCSLFISILNGYTLFCTI